MTHLGMELNLTCPPRGSTVLQQTDLRTFYKLTVCDFTKAETCSRKGVIPVVCVKIGKGMYSNTTVSIKVYLMAILDNYMFRPLLAIFRSSSTGKGP